MIAENKVEEGEELPLVLFTSNTDDWFSDVSYFLTYGDCPSHLSAKAKRNLKLKAHKYVI